MADFTGRVVVKLREDIQVPYQDAAEGFLDQELADLWAEVGAAFGITMSLDRWLPEFDGDQLQSFPSLPSYFAVNTGGKVDPAVLADAIFQLDFVELAYAETFTTLPSPPSQTPDDPEFPNETHLQPAPAGVDALAAWLETRGDGEGTRLVDIEEDWDVAHVDLPSITVGSGSPQGNIDHGTGVLGIIAAVPENTTDCIGIAPAVDVEVVSIFRPTGGFDAASAMIAAVLDLVPLDPNGPTPVILLEQQSGALGPVEMEPGFADMIKAVVDDIGIIVVEPGGNGGVNLDAFTPAAGAKNPFDRAQFDSGAIITGACMGPNDPDPLAPMNVPGGITSFGTRVDCFAQGKDIVTLSPTTAATINRHFGGTSGASAIVASTAAIVSALFTEANGTPIPPRDLRQLLADSGVNTGSSSPAADLIGTMPDLDAIISNGF